MARDELAAEGYNALVCDGADDLVVRVRGGAFDLVLADVDALGLGPGEFTARVKREAPQAVVVVISQDGTAAAVVEALRAGACDYLRKPLRAADLRERLRQALARRRLGLSVRQRTLRLAYVNELSGSFSASLDLHEVLRAAAGALRTLADFDLAAAVLREPAGDASRVYPLTPGADALWPSPVRVPLAESALCESFHGNQPRLVADLRRETLPRDLATLGRDGFCSLLLLPLVSKQAAVGAVALASRNPGAFDASDLDLLQHVSDHLASAVVNARLYSELKTLSARLEDTVRERTREANEVRQRLESLLETAGDAIITVDLEYRIRSWNHGAEQILGHARVDTLGKNICSLASGEAARSQLARVLALAVEGETSTSVETTWVRRDRKEATLSLTASPIVGGGEQLVGVLVIARDITEQQRLQEELFHSEKLASIGQLAAGVAHQINNPLGAISGRAQMLLRLSGPPDADFLREQLGKIRADCARITETVNDLLGFARKTDTVKQRAHLGILVDETLEMVRHGLSAQKVRIERCYADHLPPILASANHLRQLFANLITNALDAMPDGGTLTITTRLLPAAGERPEPAVEVAFADTGTGIAPEDMARIFEPFFTTKPAGQGTGLGLAVAKRIVDFHNGRIDVESKLGLGTTFTVQFPVG